MQHWELLCPGGLSFVCDDGLFQPSTDSFLLGSFPRLKPGLRVCDLGSGTGLLGLLLFQRQRALSVTGVELLPDAVRLAEQAAARNGLADRLIFRRGDLRKIRGLLPAGGFDLVVCNPPYYPAGSGRLPETEALRLPGPRLAAPWRISARQQPGCCGGAGASAWSTSRSGWRTCAAPSGPGDWSPSGCASSAAGRGTPLPCCCWRPAGADGPGWTSPPPSCLEDGPGRPTAELDNAYFRTKETNA